MVTTETQAPELSPEELLRVIEFRIHEPELSDSRSNDA